jgi:hypothetical protein
MCAREGHHPSQILLAKVIEGCAHSWQQIHPLVGLEKSPDVEVQFRLCCHMRELQLRHTVQEVLLSNQLFKLGEKIGRPER